MTHTDSEWLKMIPVLNVENLSVERLLGTRFINHSIFAELLYMMSGKQNKKYNLEKCFVSSINDGIN